MEDGSRKRRRAQPLEDSSHSAAVQYSQYYRSSQEQQGGNPVTYGPVTFPPSSSPSHRHPSTSAPVTPGIAQQGESATDASGYGSSGYGMGSSGMNHLYQQQQQQQLQPGLFSYPTAAFLPDSRQMFVQYPNQYPAVMMYGVPQSQQGYHQQQPAYGPVMHPQSQALSGQRRSTVVATQAGSLDYLQSTAGSFPSAVASSHSRPQSAHYYNQPTQVQFRPTGHLSRSVTDSELLQVDKNAKQAEKIALSQEAKQKFQTGLKEILQSSEEDRLEEVAKPLLELSEHVLDNLTELDLLVDDEWKRLTRLQFWANFNYCWLTVLQRQMDLSEYEIETGSKPSPPKCRISREMLREMGDSLIKLCDGVESLGLVDYEQGVWEDQIIEILKACYYLSTELEPSDPEQNPNSSRSGTPDSEEEQEESNQDEQEQEPRSRSHSVRSSASPPAKRRHLS